MRHVTVAATQMACSWDLPANLDKAEALVREAAGRGANIVLLQELFEAPYFCADQLYEHFPLAKPLAGNLAIARFSALAKELGVVIPVSFFERDTNEYYNSLAMIDADGASLGLYRKTHIPQFPGYNEKFYFSPGNTGFRVFDTRFGRIGAGICWDQWFPETARSLALQGAELLLYPTAIGSEVVHTSHDSCPHWQRTMQGHAAANMVPVIASNRTGTEHNQSCDITFFGSSFITDHLGQKIAEADKSSEGVILQTFDLDLIRQKRTEWGLFRDRRPETYGLLVRGKGQ